MFSGDRHAASRAGADRRGRSLNFVWRALKCGVPGNMSARQAFFATMIRFLFRLLSVFALSVAAIMAVLDATRSLAASAPVVTSLATEWSAASPDTLEAVRHFVDARLPSPFWDLLIAPVLSLPGFVVFAVLAFLLHTAGRRPRRPSGHLAI